MIPAHDSPVASLTFNSLATLLASASEKVFDCSFSLLCHSIVIRVNFLTRSCDFCCKNLKVVL